MNKPLPFRGAAGKYKITTSAKIAEGNRIITNDAKEVASIIEMLANSPFKNIVLDDMNYISQDFYMKNALKGGWSPHIQTTFHVRRPTRFHFKDLFVYGAITHYGGTFQSLPLKSKKLKG